MMYGCDFGAKSDPVVTVIPTAKETGNYELRTKSYARKVIHKDGKTTGVLYVDMRTGLEYEQPADIVDLGGDSLYNTKLMLTSEFAETYDPNRQKGVMCKSYQGF